MLEISTEKKLFFCTEYLIITGYFVRPYNRIFSVLVQQE
nr:MAG TPA: Honey bee toxin [Caudoviricetes sp.]